MARLRAIMGNQWRRTVRIVDKGAFSRRRRDGAGLRAPSVSNRMPPKFGGILTFRRRRETC
jgi:hypothetical protein